MSGSGGGNFGGREVAVRCFAAEYDDADFEYSESDEERAPNYVVTPTGARVNRLFVVGVLTEVEPVSDDVLRARVVDPTGAFVVYAGQYQPDAKTFLERAEPPEFVAVTGKARTFEPDDADVVYTSVRPESINAVDSDTRDRWTVQAAEATLDRVATCAAALEREESGQALREALFASDVEPALAAGIPRAIEHYGTTGAYLAAVREMAIQAAEVVAGDRDEVEPLGLAPDEGGSADVDLAGGATIAAAAGTGTGAEAATEAAASAEASTATSKGGDEAAAATVEADSGDADAETDDSATAGVATGADETAEAATAAEPAGGDDLGDFDDYGTDEAAAGEAEEAETSEPTTADAGAATDELYEMDEEERAAVEEEFGTDFSTGNEVDEPGEADIETPEPDEGDADGEEASETDEGGPAASGTDADGAEDEPAAAEVEEEDDEEEETGGPTAGEVDLEDAVVAAMGDLDEGDGADREAVVEAVADEHGADREAVEEAVQDALMGGRCYEPEDGRLKAI